MSPKTIRHHFGSGDRHLFSPQCKPKHNPLRENKAPKQKHSRRFCPHLSVKEVWHILRIRLNASANGGSWPQSPTQRSLSKGFNGIFTTWLPHVSILYIMVSLRKLSLKLENAHKKPSKNRFPFQIHQRFSIHFSLMSSRFPKEGPLLVINGMYEYEGPIKLPHSTWTTGVFVTRKSGVK